MQSMSRRTFARAAQSLLVAAGLLAFSPSRVTAQTTSSTGTDWSAIRDALHADGIVQPGNILCFDLVRQDLTPVVAGVPVSPGEIANGHIHFKPLGNGRFFVEGSLPAQGWQASDVAAALRTVKDIDVGAIVNHAAKVWPVFIWVHFEAKGTPATLMPGIVNALNLLHNPQLGVTAQDVNVTPWVPDQFRALFSKGVVTQINDIYVFGTPRPDEQLYRVSNIPASPFLGVGEFVYVQPVNPDGSQLIFNTEFSLRNDEVNLVIDELQRGGFTVPALHNHFLDDNYHLYFVHGFALGLDPASTAKYEQTLYNVFQIIHAHNK